ncbi:MAG: hypothetical protein MI723_14385 [Caulobacterales bacterium]|nr:hypothetical protein [Caulobacterales bacterium]
MTGRRLGRRADDAKVLFAPELQARLAACRPRAGQLVSAAHAEARASGRDIRFG